MTAAEATGTRFERAPWQQWVHAARNALALVAADRTVITYTQLYDRCRFSLGETDLPRRQANNLAAFLGQLLHDVAALCRDFDEPLLTSLVVWQKNGQPTEEVAAHYALGVQRRYGVPGLPFPQSHARTERLKCYAVFAGAR